MAQWVLKANGNVVPRWLVHPLSQSKLASETEIKKGQLFDELIQHRWGSPITSPVNDSLASTLDEYDDNTEAARIIPELDDPVDLTGLAINTQPLYDQVIHSELLLPQDGVL